MTKKNCLKIVIWGEIMAITNNKTANETDYNYIGIVERVRNTDPKRYMFS